MNIKNKILLSSSAMLLVCSALLSLNGVTVIPAHHGISVRCISILSLPELPGGGKYNGSLMVQLQKTLAFWILLASYQRKQNQATVPKNNSSCNVLSASIIELKKTVLCL